MPIDEPPQFANFPARMMEIASTRAPWHRRLWRGGTMQIARELLDESTRAGAPESAINDLRGYVQHCLATDFGIADHGKSAHSAMKALKPGVTDTSHEWIYLRELFSRMNDAYLSNWADSFDNPTSRGKIDLEGAARRITAHILDSGMHMSSIYAWLRSIRDDSTRISIRDFLHEADERLSAPLKQYTFCVPVERPGIVDVSNATGWMTAQETADWKRQHAPSAPGLQQRGSFILVVDARDVNAAADAARARIFNLSSKFSLSTRSPVVVATSMWSREKGSEFPTQATNRLINVQAFQRLDRVHDLQMPEYITNTLALAQPLRTAAPHIAVMSGWSVIESLMVGPSDATDVVAAERFALIVAASMVRAELTRLSRKYAEVYRNPVAAEMAACDRNIDRARLFQIHIASGAEIDLQSPVDNLALSRIRPALSSPRPELEKIARILRREFTRLYRKRNLVVHGGHTLAADLHSISETLAPLIGAGIDRVVHVGLKFDVGPIELSAMAESRLHYLTPATPDDPGNLLSLLEF